MVVKAMTFKKEKTNSFRIPLWMLESLVSGFVYKCAIMMRVKKKDPFLCGKTQKGILVFKIFYLKNNSKFVHYTLLEVVFT